MTSPLPWPPGQAPYVTPDQLYQPGGISQWPVGVQWGTIPGTSADSAQQYSVLSMICSEATVRADEIAQTTLRATTTTEELEGPHFRVTVQVASANGRIICSRWPVLAVSQVQVCPNSAWPRQWTTIPAGYCEPEFPAQGLYGTNTPAGYGEGAQSVLVAPGYINWRLRREGWRVRITYTAGLGPHSCLTSAATAGGSTIEVDDCTWWAPQSSGASGAAGVIYDAMGGGQEPVSCTAASVPAGPGTLTLASPLNFSHAAGIMVSALPQTAIWAAAMLAGASALTRGATATTIQTTAGRAQMSSPSLLDDLARKRLNAFRRTI